MNVINFVQAKRRIQAKHQEESEIKTAFKLRYLSNSELFSEYKSYRCTLEDTSLDAGEKIDTESLIYLCEVALEVAARGLLEDFDKRYNFMAGLIE
jgi:hypothetical protein